MVGSRLHVSVPDDDTAARVRSEVPDVEVVVWDGDGPGPDALREVTVAVPPYRGATWTSEQVAQLPRLELLQVLSAGYEAWLPVLPETVTLCNGRGIHGRSTAELAVTGLLAVVHELPLFAERQRAHRWEAAGGATVADSDVLVVGAGDVGQHVADGLRALGARVTVTARHARDGVEALTDLAAQVRGRDALVLAVPLTDATRGLVDARVLAALPDGAVVVNVSRGPVVVTDDLLAELTSGRLRAFLDVTDPEPLPGDHPLWSAPGLVLTPHVGGGTVGWWDRAADLVVDQVRRLAAGEPPEHVVRPGSGTSAGD